MDSTNGVLTPPVQNDTADSITPSSKRKRDDSIGVGEHINGIATEHKGTSSEESQKLVHDLIDVLKTQDTTPSILTRFIPDRALSKEPQIKRQKAEESADSKITILTRYSRDSYTTVDDVLSDIDAAVSDIRDMLQSPNSNPRHQHIPESEILMKVAAFKDRAYALVRREKASLDSNATTTNGNLTTALVAHNDIDQGAAKTVLTLYGTAPTAGKQLFSSYQLPTKLDGENERVLQPLREAGLPNGIQLTKVVPSHARGPATDKKKVPTMGELFPAPQTLPPMEPPKPSRATTREITAGWQQPSTVSSYQPRQISYYKQAIIPGKWLDYSKATLRQDSKRKQRERALSLGNLKTPQIESGNESDAAKLEALFQSAYSEFAPTKDNSDALAPEGVVAQLWWQEYGAKSFERFVENASNLESSTRAENESTEVLEDLDIEELEKLAVDMEQDTIDPSLVPLNITDAEKSAQEKDVEEVLIGISELLETLNSYQRNRHISLKPASRSGIPSMIDSSQGTISIPSESEQATYDILRSSLELMIGSLPPYAVAKLDADRLADLSISTKIQVEVEDHKGVMGEDEAYLKKKAQVTTHAPVPTTSSTRTSSSSQMYGNQYSASQYSAPRAAAPPYYNGSHQTPIRPPTNNFQRAPATAPPYNPQRPVTTPVQQQYRPPYVPQNYGQQAARVAQPPYQASSNQQYHNSTAPQPPYVRPTPGYQQPVQQPTHPAPANNGYARQAYQQQQGTPNGTNYSYGHTPSRQPSFEPARQASPQKGYNHQQGPPYQQSTPQPRPYGTPTPTPAQALSRPSSFLPQTSMVLPVANGTSSQPQTPSHVPQTQFSRQPTGPTNFNTFMTQEQQSSMMERNRAQLAQQQGLQQQQARSAAQAAAGSSSNGQVNGSPVAVGSRVA